MNDNKKLDKLLNNNTAAQNMCNLLIDDIASIAENYLLVLEPHIGLISSAEVIKQVCLNAGEFAVLSAQFAEVFEHCSSAAAQILVPQYTKLSHKDAKQFLDYAADNPNMDPVILFKEFIAQQEAKIES